MKTLLSTLALSLVASLSIGCVIPADDTEQVSEETETLRRGDIVIKAPAPLERCDMVHMICSALPGQGVVCEVTDSDCDVETADASFNGMGVIMEGMQSIPIDGCGMVDVFCYVNDGGAIDCHVVNRDCSA